MDGLTWLVIGAGIGAVVVLLWAPWRRRGEAPAVEPVAPVATAEPAPAAGPSAPDPDVMDLGGCSMVVPDGDGLTFVERVDGGEVALRLWGIDAPEIRRPIQPLAHEAREKLIGLVAAPGGVRREKRRHYVDKVTITVKDGITARVVERIGEHDRAVVHLFDGEASVNRAMVACGMAWRDERYDRGEFAEADREARAAGAGVHKPGRESVEPWKWRKRHSKGFVRQSSTDLAAALAASGATSGSVDPAIAREPVPAPAADPTRIPDPSPARWPWVLVGAVAASVVAWLVFS